MLTTFIWLGIKFSNMNLLVPLKDRESLDWLSKYQTLKTLASWNQLMRAIQTLVLSVEEIHCRLDN
jgi:hypothetical protein